MFASLDLPIDESVVARRIGLVIIIFGLAAAAVFWLLFARGGRKWDATGTVVGFGADEHTVFIAHGDIPGLMPAMTMPFAVSSPASLEKLEVQDSVAFSLRIADGKTIAENFHVIRSGNAGRRALYFPHLPDSGSVVPSIWLTDMNENTFNLSTPKTYVTLLTFIYTRCPLPDFCPLMSQKFQELQGPLMGQFGQSVRLLSISFDPEWDTPAVLREYAARYTRDTTTWRFATGSPEEIRRATEFFGVTVETDGVFLDHNLTTALIDSSAVVRAVWPGNDWELSDVIGAVEMVVGIE